MTRSYGYSNMTIAVPSLSPLRLRLLIASLLTVSFLGALDHTVVSTSLATIAGDLGALDQMSVVIVAYTLAGTVLLPVFGKISDLFGGRAVFLTSLAGFLAASLFCGLAQTMTQLAIARVVQGIGAAGVQLISQTIVAQTTSPRQRPKYLSIIGAAFPIAILIGPLAGGVITDTLGWRWVFWINIPIGAVALALAAVAVPRIVGRSEKRFDAGGFLTFGVGTVATVLAASWGSAANPDHTGSALAALTVAVLAVAAFVVIERRASEPLIPPRLFTDRTIVLCLILSAVIGIGLFSVVSYVPTYVQMVYRTSATVSGAVPIATVFGMLVSMLLTGSVAGRTGRYRMFPIIGSALSALGLFIMALLPVGVPLWSPMIVMGVVGIGTGAFMNLIIAVVQSAADRRDTGAATATVNLVRQIGATAATAIIGGLIGVGVAARLPAALNASELTPQLVHAASAALQSEVALAYADVVRPVFVGLAITYAIGFVAAVLLPAGRLPEESELARSTTSESMVA